MGQPCSAFHVHTWWKQDGDFTTARRRRSILFGSTMKIPLNKNRTGPKQVCFWPRWTKRLVFWPRYQPTAHLKGAFRSNLGISISPKDTLTWRLKQLKIELLIFGLVDDSLYPLSHSRPEPYSIKQTVMTQPGADWYQKVWTLDPNHIWRRFEMWFQSDFYRWVSVRTLKLDFQSQIQSDGSSSDQPNRTATNRTATFASTSSKLRHQHT